VAVVAADVGKQNAARSERATTVRSGGGATALWTFGAVAVALAALGGFALYRRRRTGRAW
jgi:MYXO-CTERM domain-containing protein